MQHVVALEGLKVADFSWIGVGPLATKYLADYGAQVVRIEDSRNPENLRITAPFKGGIAHPDRGGLFHSLNSSKYSITIDLRRPKGIEIARKLVMWSDVVVENFAAGTMRKFGLDYEALKKTKRDLIMLSSNTMGQTGPYREVAGFGWNVFAFAGFLHFTGWPDRWPVITPSAYPDHISPWFGVAALMAALEYRRRTGKGQYIDLSQIEACLHFLAPALLDYSVNQRVGGRCGNRSPRAAPHGAFRCKGDDRWCSIAVFSDDEWEALCRVMGRPDLLDDPRFATFLSRKANEDEVDAVITEWTVKYSAEEIMALLQKAGVPAGVIQDAADVIERDPQLQYRHYFEELQQPMIGKCLHQKLPARLTRTPPQLRPSPCLGEHNEYVCTKILGMGDEEFLKLLAEGVFGEDDYAR